MTNAWGTELTDAPDMTWDDVYRVNPNAYAPAPPPAYDPASDLDSWESPAMAEQGLSTISGDPFDGGHATAATGYEDYSAPQYQAPEPQNPLLDPVMQEALAGFNSETVAEPSYAPSPVLGQTFPPQVFEDGSTAYPGDPGYNSVDVSGNPLLSDTGTMRFDPNIALDPSQVDDQRNKFNRAQQIVMDNMGVLRFADTGEPVDPSMYQYFGFGATGQPLNSASRSILSNPQFAESNAQYDASVDPNQRHVNADPVGWYVSGLKPLVKVAEQITENVARNRSLQNMVANPSALTGNPREYYPAQESMVRPVVDALVPQSPLDFTLLGLGVATGLADDGVMGAVRNLANVGDDFGEQALPGFAGKAKSALQVPEYADEAAALAETAGRTIIPRTLPARAAEDFPEGIRLAGASGDAFKDPIPPSWIGASEDAARGVSHFDVGDYTVGVENLSGSTDELVVNIERNGVADAAAYTGRTPGGTATSLRPVGEFIQQLADANPEKRILAEASDARRLEAYQRMGFKQAVGKGEGLLELDRPALDRVLDRGRVSATMPPPTTEVSSRTLASSAEEAASSAPPLTPRTAVAEAAQNPQDFAGNIRLAKYPEDVQPEIQAWADAHPNEVASATRGVVSNEQTMAEARQLVQDTGGNFGALVKSWKPGEAWNASEITALRGVLNEKTDAVLAAAKAVQEGATDANQLELVNALREQARIQEAVHGVTAEAGRALQALKMDAAYLRANPDSEIARNLVKQAGFDPDQMENVARMLTAAADNPAQVNSIVRNIKKPGLMDYLNEVWINSLLAGPMTYIRNFLSNTATRAITPLERGVAAAVDIPMSRLQGRQVERFFGEVGADGFGAISGIRDGIDAALYTITHDGIRPGSASKIEFEHAIKGPVGRVIRAPSTMLEAADALHYTINYRAAISTEAFRQASKEGLHGSAKAERIAQLLADPTEAMIKAAKTDAEYRVFRAPAGKWTQAIMNLRNQITPLKFVIPFLKTPANLMKYGLERSPAGLIDPALWRAVKAGSPEASDRVARAIVGSSIAAGIAMGVADGKITGAVPDTASVRDRFYREGKQPFSVNIGGNWVSYQQMEPLNQAFAQVYAAVDAMKNGKPADQAVTQALTTIGTNLVSQTYMSGLSDALNAIQDPERYGSNWLGRTATGFIPFSSAMRTVDRAVDPKIRDAKGIKEIIQSNIPGLSDNIPARLDALGNEVNRGSPWYSPIGVSNEDISAIDAELGKTGAEVGFVGTSIGGNKLSRDEQFAYQRIAGQMTQVVLDQLITNDRYQGLSLEQRAQVIDDSIGNARGPVRDMLEAIIESDGYQQASKAQKKEIMDSTIEKFLQALEDRVGSR